MIYPPLRPPAARPEGEFLRRCIRCGQCVEVCPHGTLELLDGFGSLRNTPRVNPDSSPCQLCLKCPPACPTGALDASIKDMHQVDMGQAYILKDKCHNHTDGIMCMTCYDRCPLRGEAMVLSGGFIPAPTTACVGCGVCQYVCPIDAVVVVPSSVKEMPAEALSPLAPQPKTDMGSSVTQGWKGDSQ